MEYLATGTPIISTDFPALRPYKSAIHTVNSVAEFNSSLNSIQQEWLKQNKEALHKRTQQQTKLIKSHTWQAKAKQLEAWLEAL